MDVPSLQREVLLLWQRVQRLLASAGTTWQPLSYMARVNDPRQLDCLAAGILRSVRQGEFEP